ncbi:MAG TPA: Asp-tRNA(Asn)/Glu-tRNA(Gln) amidotransferase subunit GatA [Candidatus Acidoferrales bacterium]|nr:Asp-tRNA(Asn)/Glu-tRNA(Gln) amidotransferase subunit GatA [Candidatus Acidoferrales bacterium]
MKRLLDAKQISSVELLNHTFETIDRDEPNVRAFISLADRKELLKEATQIDSKRIGNGTVGEFAGIPIAVKDNIAVAGHRLTCGSRILENYIPPYSATSIERLKASGIIIVGKTNMDEFGFGSSTENSAFFPTHNPHSLDRVPGGTSGGSAAAVAAGFVPWALGTDTGGSVRQPASLCGVVGMRPTYGRVSRYGLVAFASSMDQIGPLATSVDDAAALLSTISGSDPKDATSLPEPPLDFTADTRRIRIGIPKEYVSQECQTEILQAIDYTVAVASRLGWEVSTVSLPRTEYALAAYYLISSVEAASNLARYDGVKYGYSYRQATSWEELVVASRSHGFGREAKRRIMLGTYASSAGYSEKYYLKASDVRQIIAREFEAAFESVDVLLSPVSPTTAWPLGERTSDPVRMYLSDVYSVPVALAGLPAAVLPIDKDAEGLPIGLQICGQYGQEALVVAVSHQLEQALPARSHDRAESKR